MSRAAQKRPTFHAHTPSLDSIPLPPILASKAETDLGSHGQPGSPTSLADLKHRAQLINYERKNRALDADETFIYRIISYWGNSSHRGGTIEIKALSGDLSDAEDGTSQARAWYRPRIPTSAFFARRNRRLLVCLLVVGSLYWLLAKPFLESLEPEAFGSNVNWSLSSTLLRRGSDPHDDSAVNLRAVLPSTSRSARDHPVEHGLLIVDSEIPTHPIYQLIRDARTEWDEKNARQSRTLQEAVVEYQKRYKANPPKGFDKWWAYIVYVACVLTAGTSTDCLVRTMCNYQMNMTRSTMICAPLKLFRPRIWLGGTKRQLSFLIHIPWRSRRARSSSNPTLMSANSKGERLVWKDKSHCSSLSQSTCPISRQSTAFMTPPRFWWLGLDARN